MARRIIANEIPPFSKNLITKVGKSFLSLVGKYFPATHKLKKIFNRKKKLAIVACRHNHKIIEEVADPNKKSCNFFNIRQRPLHQICLIENSHYFSRPPQLYR